MRLQVHRTLKHIIHLSSHYLQNLSILTNKKVLFLKKICGTLVFETLKNKTSDFLNSNTCFCSGLYRIFMSVSQWEKNLNTKSNQQPPRAQHGYINVRIDLQVSRFSLNKKISIPCTVNSYSTPSVSWKYNGRLVRSGPRIQVNTLFLELDTWANRN